MNKIVITGGARIGLANATSPFVTLTVTRDRLDVNASIIGSYSFTIDDIVSIEPYSSIGQGIKINHKVPNYKKQIIFWTPGNKSGDIIKQIEETGFFTRNTRVNQEIKDQVIERQKQGGFPLKMPFAISTIIIFNTLFLFGLFYSSPDKMPFKGMALAFGYIFILSTLILISKYFRVLVLKRGREKKDISKFLYFLITISLIFLLTSLIANFS